MPGLKARNPHTGAFGSLYDHFSKPKNRFSQWPFFIVNIFLKEENSKWCKSGFFTKRQTRPKRIFLKNRISPKTIISQRRKTVFLKAAGRPAQPPQPAPPARPAQPSQPSQPSAASPASQPSPAASPASQPSQPRQPANAQRHNNLHNDIF